MPEGMGDGYATFHLDVDDVETARTKAGSLGGTRAASG